LRGFNDFLVRLLAGVGLRYDVLLLDIVKEEVFINIFFRFFRIDI